MEARSRRVAPCPHDGTRERGGVNKQNSLEAASISTCVANATTPVRRGDQAVAHSLQSTHDHHHLHMRTSTWLHGTESGGPISSPASLHTCFSSTIPTAHSTPARTISAHLGSNLQMRNSGSINISASNSTGKRDGVCFSNGNGPLVFNLAYRRNAHVITP